MPGGHGGGRRHVPPAEWPTGTLWKSALLATLFSAAVACSIPVMQTRPDDRVESYLILVVFVAWCHLIIVSSVAGDFAELGRRDGQVPGWVGRHPLRTALSLSLGVTLGVAATGFAVRAVVGWGD